MQSETLHGFRLHMGGTSISIAGCESPQAAIWNVFGRAVCSLRSDGLTGRKVRRALRSYFSKDHIRELDGIARRKLGTSNAGGNADG